MGPLLALLALILAGCGNVVPAATVDVELGSEEIGPGQNTTLTVTAANTGDTVLRGELTVTTDGGDKVNVTHPDANVLETTLYPDESVTRRFTVTGTTTTQRTDYEVTVAYKNASMNHSEESTVISVIN